MHHELAASLTRRNRLRLHETLLLFCVTLALPTMQLTESPLVIKSHDSVSLVAMMGNVPVSYSRVHRSFSLGDVSVHRNLARVQLHEVVGRQNLAIDVDQSGVCEVRVCSNIGNLLGYSLILDLNCTDVYSSCDLPMVSLQLKLGVLSSSLSICMMCSSYLRLSFTVPSVKRMLLSR